MAQSLAAGKLNDAESFLLHAKDNTIMIARKNETERTPVPNGDDHIRNYKPAQVSAGFCCVIQKEPQSSSG